MRGFYHLQSGVVKPGWIDRNGHMNVVEYMRIFDEGSNRFLKAAGISNSTMGKERLTVVAGRINIIHRKELLCGEPWQLSSGLVTITSQYLTLVHRLISGETVRAYCYIRGVVFCTQQRVAKALDDKLLLRLNCFMVPGLNDPFEISLGGTDD